MTFFSSFAKRFSKRRRGAEQAYLNDIKLSFECPVLWSSMTGDERIRHCGQCDKNVYNVSEMNRAEAVEFLRNATEETCIQFYRRSDGSVMTEPCPSTIRKLRRATLRKVACVATAIGWFGLAQTALAVDEPAVSDPSGRRTLRLEGSPHACSSHSPRKSHGGLFFPALYPSEDEIKRNCFQSCQDKIRQHFGSVAAIGLLVAAIGLARRRRAIWIAFVGLVAVSTVLGFI